MHQLAVGQDTQKSWPVGITGFGVGVIDHPRTGALADAAAAAPACAAAPAAGPSSTTAAPKATTARRNRARIATPTISQTACREAARETVDKPAAAPAPGERCAEDLVLPALCGQSVARRSDQRQRPALQVCPGFTLALALVGLYEPTPLAARPRPQPCLAAACPIPRRAVIAPGANMRSSCALTRANSTGPPLVHTRQREVELRSGVTLRN